MKSKITFLSAIILSILITIVSCKRDNINLTEQNITEDYYSQHVMKRIEAFRLKIQSNYKTGTTMTLDTAVWNLEALLTNYGGYPDSASTDFILMKAHFTIPVDANQLVLESDVQSVYLQMVDSITAQLNSIAGNVKFLKFSDVQKDSIVGNTAYLTSNNGYGVGLILGLYDPFDDDWIWGTVGEEYGTPPSGNCDGTDFTSDGSGEIQYRLNHPAAVPNAIGYTDIETKQMIGWDFVDENQEPRLYVGTEPNHCMDIAELTENLNNADDIINTNEPEGLRPTNKNFISTVIIDTETVPSGTIFYVHFYEVSYGIPYFYND